MINKIKGTRDYYGLETLRIQEVFNKLEEVAGKYSLEKVITPTMEQTSLFDKGVGTTTDVVNKEMFTFKDRKDRSISLKPEGTASIVRMAIENKLLDNNQEQDLYYISQMFRYERPQKGRQREFYQFGVERFGKDDSYSDVETIMIALEIIKELNIDKYELQINTIGNSEDRKNYNQALKEFVESKIDELSDYAKEKYSTGNVMRIFDSKIESDLLALEGAPKISEYISEEAKARFEEIQNLLTKNGIQYVVNGNLVRGLDYYNDLVFEIVSTDIENLGSKSTIIGGGRYDSLVNTLDESKNSPAIGFAIGIERLMLAAKDYLEGNVESAIDYFVAVAYPEPEMKEVALEISKSLRLKGQKVKVDFSKRKLQKKYELAEKDNSTNIVIIGNEITEGKVTIKNLKNNTSEVKLIKEI